MSPGDRVTHKYDGDKTGVVVAGPGRLTVQQTSGPNRPSFFIEVGPGYCLVQFDGQGPAQIVAEQHLEVVS